MRTLLMAATAAAALLTTQAFVSSQAWAADPGALTKAQIAKLQSISGAYDKKVLAGFAGDEKTLSAMRAELKLIDAEKDLAKQRTLIKGYQSKYAKTYQAALKKGGVDLNSLAAELRPVFPELTFTVRDGYVTGTLTPHLTLTPLPAPPPGPTTATLGGADFQVTRDLGCGAVAGSSISTSGLSMTTSGWAAVAGGCSNSGTMTHSFDLPADRTGRVDLGADLSGEAFALGIAGAATSSVTASVSIYRPDGNLVGTGSTHCVALAALAWAASESCASDNLQANGTFTATGTYRVISYTHVFNIAAGVVAGTNATAKVRNLNVTVTTTPR